MMLISNIPKNHPANLVFGLPIFDMRIYANHEVCQQSNLFIIRGKQVGFFILGGKN